MRRILIAIISLAGPVGICSVDAHIGDQVYEIQELTDEDLENIDLTDGSVADWQQVVGEPTLTALDFPVKYGPADYDPSDLDFRVWLAWHQSTSRIYVAMERIDDIYVNQYDFSGGEFEGGFQVVLFHDSSISLRVDGDHSGGEYNLSQAGMGHEIWSLESQRQAQEFHAIGQVHGGGHCIDLQGFPGGDWYTRQPYAECGGASFGDGPVVSITEFAVTPFDDLVKDDAGLTRPSTLTPGQIIGLGLSVSDYDDPDRDLGNGAFAMKIDATYSLPTGEARMNASFMADALLTSAYVGTVAESTTWARIKATFMD